MVIGESVNYYTAPQSKYQVNSYVQITRRKRKTPKYFCILTRHWGINLDSGGFQLVGRCKITGRGEAVNAAAADLIANAVQGGIHEWQFEEELSKAVKDALAHGTEMTDVNGQRMDMEI